MPKGKPRGRRNISKRWLSVVRYLPCFFDVPVKQVHSILGISHHTLDPMRRAFNLNRWPYSEVVNGKFHMTQEDIAELRRTMMPTACEPIKQILTRMATCADECRAQNDILPVHITKFMHQGAEQTASKEPEEINVWEEHSESESSKEFWNDIARIFMLGEAASEPHEAKASGN